MDGEWLMRGCFLAFVVVGGTPPAAACCCLTRDGRGADPWMEEDRSMLHRCNSSSCETYRSLVPLVVVVFEDDL